MFHNRELQILNTIAKSNTPVIAQDIVNESKISQSTVQTVLRSMLSHGYVESVGVVHSGNVLSRQYIITEKVKPEIIEQFVDLYKVVQDIVPINELYNALVDSI